MIWKDSNIIRLQKGDIILKLLSNIIVYYAPMEEKTWPAHMSAAQFYTRDAHIIFHYISRPKIPHSRCWAGSESGTFGQDMVKSTVFRYLYKSENPPKCMLVKEVVKNYQQNPFSFFAEIWTSKYIWRQLLPKSKVLEIVWSFVHI